MPVHAQLPHVKSNPDPMFLMETSGEVTGRQYKKQGEPLLIK